MLRIHRAQLEPLADEARRSFADRMVAYLGEHFPNWIAEMSGADREAGVRAAIATCERWEVTTEPEAAQLILLLLVLGLDADEAKPWVREVLADRDLLPIGKLRKLAESARARDVAHVEDVVVYDWMEG